MYNIDTDTHTCTFMHKSYSIVLQGRQTDRQTFISLPTSCCLMVYKNNNYIKKANHIYHTIKSSVYTIYTVNEIHVIII